MGSVVFLGRKSSFFSPSPGYTHRFPLRVESRAASTLSVSWSWSGRPPGARDLPYGVTLYRAEPDGLALLCNDTASSPRYRFRGLEGCRSYVVCVEPELRPSILCLATPTGTHAPAATRPSHTGPELNPQTLRPSGSGAKPADTAALRV